MEGRKGLRVVTVGVVLLVLQCGGLLGVDLGYWDSGTEELLNEDVNTVNGIGQWTETFVGSWGVGSWVKGNGTNGAGEKIWELDGPTIVASHPSVYSDGNGDGYPDTVLTNYQGGTFWLYDAAGLWGTGAEFSCVDTIIEDHFNPFAGSYEYGYVWGTAVNEALGLTVNLYGRVIETSSAGASHSGEMTELTIEVVPEPMTVGLLVLGVGVLRRREEFTTKTRR